MRSPRTNAFVGHQQLNLFYHLPRHMLFLLVFFIIANTAGAECSASGRRLLLSEHPFMVRLRFVGGSIVAGLGLAGYSWEHAAWVAWLGIAALVIGSARHFAPARAITESDTVATRP